MPNDENNINVQPGGENTGAVNAQGQQAEKIVNVGTNVGDIIQSTTNIYNKAEDKKPMSRLLCRKLIEAIQDYSVEVKDFLENTIDEKDKNDWESRFEYLQPAKEYIISSYVSVLGIYLERIFGSANREQYLNVSIAITKRTLQLLCFSFVSGLWDNSKDKKPALADADKELIKKFFNARTDLTITQLVNLLKILVNIFKLQSWSYFFEEIKNLEEDLNKDDSNFIKNCVNIDGFATKIQTEQPLPAIEEIEKELTDFCVSVGFLANYKMVSVKDIGYEKLRSQEKAQYLHTYTLLGVKNEKNNNGQKFNYEKDELVNTDAILLFKDNYQKGLNLFPFVIDINAITDQRDQLVKICFYDCNDVKKEDDALITRLKYFVINKISPDNDEDAYERIMLDKQIESDLSDPTKKDIITRYKKEDNSNKFQAMRKNEVFKTFELARKTILE